MLAHMHTHMHKNDPPRTLAHVVCGCIITTAQCNPFDLSALFTAHPSIEQCAPVHPHRPSPTTSDAGSPGVHKEAGMAKKKGQLCIREGCCIRLSLFSYLLKMPPLSLSFSLARARSLLCRTGVNVIDQ